MGNNIHIEKKIEEKTNRKNWKILDFLKEKFSNFRCRKMIKETKFELSEEKS